MKPNLTGELLKHIRMVIRKPLNSTTTLATFVGVLLECHCGSPLTGDGTSALPGHANFHKLNSNKDVEEARPSKLSSTLSLSALHPIGQKHD
ncbi:hypothetical protein V8C43DRAFT_267412 [Trichoderma afarasin]